MKANQTITVWKSDFKDFPYLHEATMWCMGACVQKANNFVVIRGYNPYEMLNDAKFTSMRYTYELAVSIAKENNWEIKAIDRLHSMEYTAEQVCRIMLSKLDYPEGHIRRVWE